jgi:hypothetical protein
VPLRSWPYLVKRCRRWTPRVMAPDDARMTTTELAQTIQDRLDVLHREIGHLEAARDQLQSDGFGSAPPTVSKAAAVRRTRRARPRRSGEVVAAVKLEGLLAEHSVLSSVGRSASFESYPVEGLSMFKNSPLEDHVIAVWRTSTT